MGSRTPRLPTVLLDSRASVYAEDPTTGAFTTLVTSDLPCRLGTVSAGAAVSPAERAALLSTRRLVWGPDTAIAETAQVEIAGQRWNPVAGSFAAVTWPATGDIVYRSCDVVRAA